MLLWLIDIVDNPQLSLFISLCLSSRCNTLTKLTGKMNERSRKCSFYLGRGLQKNHNLYFSLKAGYNLLCISWHRLSILFHKQDQSGLSLS